MTNKTKVIAIFFLTVFYFLIVAGSWGIVFFYNQFHYLSYVFFALLIFLLVKQRAPVTIDAATELRLEPIIRRLSLISLPASFLFGFLFIVYSFGAVFMPMQSSTQRVTTFLSTLVLFVLIRQITKIPPRANGSTEIEGNRITLTSVTRMFFIVIMTLIFFSFSFWVLLGISLG